MIKSRHRKAFREGKFDEIPSDIFEKLEAQGFSFTSEAVSAEKAIGDMGKSDFLKTVEEITPKSIEEAEKGYAKALKKELEEDEA